MASTCVCEKAGCYLNGQWWGGGAISLEDIPFLVNKELRKIPFNAWPHKPSSSGFQKFVDGGCIFPVDKYL